MSKYDKENLKKCNDVFNALRYYMSRVEELEKENEELKEQRDNAIKLRNELIEEQKITCISKNKIRNKIKELEERKSKLHFGSDAVIIDDIETQIEVLKELLERN